MSAEAEQTRGQTRPEPENTAFSSIAVSVAMVVSIEADRIWPALPRACFFYNRAR
jgi:hypothetical protein